MGLKKCMEKFRQQSGTHLKFRCSAERKRKRKVCFLAPELGQYFSTTEVLRHCGKKITIIPLESKRVIFFLCSSSICLFLAFHSSSHSGPSRLSTCTQLNVPGLAINHCILTVSLLSVNT